MSSHLHRLTLCSVVAAAMLLAFPAASPAQQAALTSSPVSVVPHLIKYSGALPNAPSKGNVFDVKFSLYAAQTGGEALWSETQSVSLDPTGKYSVVLGSTTAAGVPDSVFANGQARWIGVTLGSEQESARTVLVATPYSLKASDSETLGGHPVSDFTLKNALPAGGTDITQINVGNGVTGGGTGPTVTLGLSSTYLENLGNEIYPQLTGTNTLTGTNNYTAGKLTISGSPALSAANVTGTSPVTATVSGNGVKIGLSDSALLTLGNSVYVQLAGANTISGANAITGISTFKNTIYNLQSTQGVYTSLFSDTSYEGGGAEGVGDYVGLGGFSTNTTSGQLSSGVIGSSSNPTGQGIDGQALAQGGTSAGVYGVLGGPSSVGPAVMNTGGGWEGAAIWADSGDKSSGASRSTALFASSDADNAGAFVNNTDHYYTQYSENEATGGYLFGAMNTADGGFCSIDSKGDFGCNGTFVTVVTSKATNKPVAIHSVSSPENWVEDFGSGALSSGSAHVAIEPGFLGTVNLGAEYHVFLTPEGDCKGLYIASKGTDGFDVRELGGGASSVAFSYRIVAKRTGMESARLEDMSRNIEILKKQGGVRTPGQKPALVAHPVLKNIQKGQRISVSTR